MRLTGAGFGVAIYSSQWDVIGGYNPNDPKPNYGNVISDNSNGGIFLSGSPGPANAGGSNAVISLNFIGTDVAGSSGKDKGGDPTGNNGDGIRVLNAGNVTIGGAAILTSANVIAGNANAGVEINTDKKGPSTKASVQNNLIGMTLISTTLLGLPINNLGLIGALAANNLLSVLPNGADAIYLNQIADNSVIINNSGWYYANKQGVNLQPGATGST